MSKRLTKEQFIARAISNGFPQQLIERSIDACPCPYKEECCGWILTTLGWQDEDYDLYYHFHPKKEVIRQDGIVVQIEVAPPFDVFTGAAFKIKVSGALE